MEAINIYSEKKLKINLSIHKVLISSLTDVYNSNLKRKVTKEKVWFRWNLCNLFEEWPQTPEEVFLMSAKSPLVARGVKVSFPKWRQSVWLLLPFYVK